MVLYVGAGLGAKAWDIYTPYAVWIKIDDRDVAVAFARSCIASTIIYIGNIGLQRTHWMPLDVMLCSNTVLPAASNSKVY